MWYKVYFKMYPSDISDKEWKTIEPYFEPKKTGRPRKHSIRGNVQRSVSNRIFNSNCTRHNLI